MRPSARNVFVLVTVVLVLWLSAAPVPKWLLIAVVCASIVFGFRASSGQKRMERRWVKSLWTKWKSTI